MAKQNVVIAIDNSKVLLHGQSCANLLPNCLTAHLIWLIPLQACLKAVDFAAKTFSKGEKLRVQMTRSASTHDVVA